MFTNDVASSVINRFCKVYPSAFLYFSFNDWPISRFILISSREIFRSLSRTKVYRQRFASPNKNRMATLVFKLLGNHYLWKEQTHWKKLIIWNILILWKMIVPIPFFPVSISFMVILSRSCLCMRRFWLYGNQPHSEMNFSPILLQQMNLPYPYWWVEWY